MQIHGFSKGKGWMALCLLLLLTLSSCTAGAGSVEDPMGDSSEAPSHGATVPNGPAESEQSSLTTPTKDPVPTPVPTPTPTPTPTPADPADFSARRENDGGTVAVWWWDKSKAVALKRGEYLDFLEKNQVNEIYICWPNFEKRQLADFVKATGKRGMSVSLLSGDASWIDPQNNGAQTVVDAFLSYQKTALPEERLLSLHMDVEPHQREDFYTEQEKILGWYADFVSKTAKEVRGAGEKIGWDIAFWFDDFTVLDETGAAVPLLDHLAQNADTLCLMSYRDSAKEVLALSEKEIALSERFGCQIICGVDTFSAEGDHVSFMEEGRTVLAKETGKLYLALQERLQKGKYGIAVHYLDTWYKLQD